MSKIIKIVLDVPFDAVNNNPFLMMIAVESIVNGDPDYIEVAITECYDDDPALVDSIEPDTRLTLAVADIIKEDVNSVAAPYLLTGAELIDAEKFRKLTVLTLDVPEAPDWNSNDDIPF